MSNISGGSKISRREGANLKSGVPAYSLAKSCRNHMKMKEIGPGGPKFYYVDLPLDLIGHIMLSDKYHMENLKVSVWNTTMQKE